MAYSAVIPWAERGAATYLPPAQLAQWLVSTWQSVTGELPSREVAELLLAQVANETAWSKSMWRFNWGNITAGSVWTGAVWRPSWYELTPSSSAKEQRLHADMLAGKAPNAFRAYLSHAAGSSDYVRMVLSRFPSIVEAAKTGDPIYFAAAVRTSNYCPDCNVGFAQSIRTLQSQIRAAGWFAHLPSASGGASTTWGLLGTALGAAALGGAAGAGAVALLRAAER